MRERLLAGLLLAAAVLVYSNTLANRFVLDDELYIVRNVQVVDPTLHDVFSANLVTNVYRPLFFATLAINWELRGGEPLGYHLINILLHAGVTWLLYLLLQELLGGTPEARTTAFVAALLYAVHPIHTEAVAWAVGRAELLAAGLLFAGWILHLRDRTFGSLACFAGAVLSKESAIVFLPLILLGDFVTGKWKSRIRYGLATALAAAYVAVLWVMQGRHFGARGGTPIMDNPLVGLPAGWRILNAVRVAWRYVALQLWPAVLSSDYSFNQIPMFRDWRHTLPAALAAVVVLGLWTRSLWKRQAGWALAGGLYFAGFATTANILINTGTVMAERLAYLPSAGFCLLLALGWQRLQQKKERVAWGLLAVAVLALSVRTVMRNRDWKDDFTLFSTDARAVPNDAKIHTNLSAQYLERHQLDLAATEDQTALRIMPDYADALALYAAVEFERGHLEPARQMVEKALRLSDRNNLNYDFMDVLYAGILMKAGHSDTAMEVLNSEIVASPQYSQAWSTRAELHRERGEFAEGRADARIALANNPRNGQARQIMLWLDAKASVPSPRPH